CPSAMTTSEPRSTRADEKKQEARQNAAMSEQGDYILNVCHQEQHKQECQAETNIQNVIALFGTRGILASILFLFGGVGIGWLLGGPGAGTKGVLALATAQRNIAAALVVGGKDFDDPKVLVMIVVVAVVGLLILMPMARFFGTRSAETPA